MNNGGNDKGKGLYHKFNISRTDNRDLKPSDPHWNCDYFVLDLSHDPHAIPAIKAYAISCQDSHPLLSKDLLEKLA